AACPAARSDQPQRCTHEREEAPMHHHPHSSPAGRRRRVRPLRLAAAALAVSLALTACGGGGGAGSAGGASGADARKQTLIIAENEPPATFDPVQADNSTVDEVVIPAYDTLLRYEGSELSPTVATE